jgi:polysaccharide export outer membrane protein
MRLISILTIVLYPIALIQAARAQERKFDQREPAYRIQSNDVIEVQYRYTPEFNHTVTVQPDGMISLQFVGPVHVGGLSVDEARAAIKKTAEQRLKDPEVTVTLKDFLKPYFTVAGEVNKPGRVELRGGMSVVEAIAMSGGFKESARRSRVILLRQVSPDQAEVKVLDLKKIMTAKNIREDMQVRAGDLLVVSQNVFSKLEPVMRLTSTGLYGLGLALSGY